MQQRATVVFGRNYRAALAYWRRHTHKMKLVLTLGPDWVYWVTDRRTKLRPYEHAVRGAGAR